MFATKKVNPSNEVFTVALDWTPNIHHMGLYVAKDMGFDKELGFEFRLLQPNRMNALLAVAHGQAHIAIGFAADVVAGRLAGLDLMSIGALYPSSESCLAWKGGRGLHNPKNWEGLTYLGWGSQREEAMLSLLMERAGGSPKRLRKVVSPFVDFVTALLSDTADVMWIFPLWDGVKARLKGLDIEVICPQSLFPGLKHPGPLILVAKVWAKDHNKEIKKMALALDKGYKASLKDPYTAAKILAKHVPETPYTLWEATALEAQRLVARYPEWAWGSQGGDTAWKEYLETLEELGIVTGAKAAYPFHTSLFLPLTYD